MLSVHLSAAAKRMLRTVPDVSELLPGPLVKSDTVKELRNAGLVHVIHIGPATYIMRTKEGREYVRSLDPRAASGRAQELEGTEGNSV